ncbi:peptide-methionine (S)-S-oxide reductase MsrA [Pseudaestuariivita atlantica]|uniref:Peptide methionine sulfoxide reductase MsrA n=1 Tax=Pseudaestuariivita atlantica TaxID=1317121 RepID=A0A0L1JPJ8_9RHOB|nr:peptide-methionine (S)-S-oxide reductase MsrA [Pseudaestuariivita atlantica]KNG93689.1 peptide methionine sulfoxide reductase [Pseudaestuariivita atlantica]
MFKFNLTALTVVLGLTLPLGASQAETLTVAGGCFWCVEADFEQVDGVSEVVSGFAGGRTENPTYKQVTGSDTGHYEVVEITFDPEIVSADQLLSLFFRSIDPTDANGQFCDRGNSYRTAIFATPEQTDAAKGVRAQAEAELGQDIVTPILPAATFYPAEDYHQDYYKSSDRIFTRFGIRRKSDAYKRYRTACGRDQRVLELWGDAAAFAK